MPTVVGLVYGATGSFQVVFLVLAAGPLLGIVPMLGLRTADIHEHLPPTAATNSEPTGQPLLATNGKD